MLCPYRSRLFNLAVLLLAILSQVDSLFADEIAVPLTLRKDGDWVVVDSPNFHCCCKLPESDARRLGECCEVWRRRLQSTWTGVAAEKANWLTKCEVIVHSSKADYNRAINRVGDPSVGSTKINFDQGRIVFCRIDVRTDADDWSNAALPHELTHVVLCERFGGHALPRWADEGIAMLSESSEKQRERLTNLRAMVSRRQILQMDEVVKMARVPNPSQRDAFYGQSVALTSFLIQRSTPDQFANFIEDSQRDGIDRALKAHYKIEGISGLQREWDRWVQQPETLEIVRLKLHEGLNPIVAFVNNR